MCQTHTQQQPQPEIPVESLFRRETIFSAATTATRPLPGTVGPVQFVPSRSRPGAICRPADASARQPARAPPTQPFGRTSLSPAMPGRGTRTWPAWPSPPASCHPPSRPLRTSPAGARAFDPRACSRFQLPAAIVTAALATSSSGHFSRCS